MSERLDSFLEVVRRVIVEPIGRLIAVFSEGMCAVLARIYRRRRWLAIAALLAAIGYYFYLNPPYATAGRGEVLVRTSALDGTMAAYTDGVVLALPGVHQVRIYSTRDQVYRPTESASANGAAPFQSNEGLSIGVDLTVRWAIDRARIARSSKDFPDDINGDLVRPALDGIAYPLFARHSVREIFSRQRSEIQQELTKALGTKLASMGLILRGVDGGFAAGLPRGHGAAARRGARN